MLLLLRECLINMVLDVSFSDVLFSDIFFNFAIFQLKSLHILFGIKACIDVFHVFSLKILDFFLANSDDFCHFIGYSNSLLTIVFFLLHSLGLNRRIRSRRVIWGVHLFMPSYLGTF